MAAGGAAQAGGHDGETDDAGHGQDGATGMTGVGTGGPVPGAAAWDVGAWDVAVWDVGVGDVAAWGGVAFGAAACGTAGAAAGAGARILLRRMRRGTRVRAPVCEAATGVAWAVVGAGWAAGLWPHRWVPVLLALTWFGVAAGAVDLRHRRLPDALTLPAVPVAFLLVAPLGGAALARAGPAALVAVAVHAAVHLGSPGSLGAGDVKLAASLGAVLAAASWGAPLLAAVLASALTALVALAGATPLGPDRRAPVPHGPSMLLATLVVVAAAAAG